MTKQFEMRVGMRDDRGAMNFKGSLLAKAVDTGVKDITALCKGQREGFIEPIRQDIEKKILAKSMIVVKYHKLFILNINVKCIC